MFKTGKLQISTWALVEAIVICVITAIDCGILIYRTIESMHQILDNLCQEDGTVLKRANNYEQRAGQTAMPIAELDIRSIQILYGLLRSFDNYTKIIIHVAAGILYWTESRSDRSARFLDMEKKKLPRKNP